MDVGLRKYQELQTFLSRSSGNSNWSQSTESMKKNKYENENYKVELEGEVMHLKIVV